MDLSVGEWKFNVDISLNMEISSRQASEHCPCGYCRNFYQTIDDAYPSMREFLSNFGVDIEGPDELSPFEPTIYEASYIVHGEILHSGLKPIYIDGIPIKVLLPEEADMDTERPEPYFVLVIGLMELPWVIEENPTDVLSPANEPEYLSRMEKKLLNRIADTALYS